MAGSVGDDGRASSGQEFSGQNQARYAVGIAELFAHPRCAAERFLRQTGFRYRSHSDGGGFGGASATQPGDRLHHDSEPAGHGRPPPPPPPSHFLSTPPTP